MKPETKIKRLEAKIAELKAENEQLMRFKALREWHQILMHLRRQTRKNRKAA